MKRVLVAPLNWGLGHASRCIPIIDHLINKGHKVFLASDGRAGHLLRCEFPDLPYFVLPSYNIKHPVDAGVWHWLQQLPTLQKAIRREHQATAALMRKHHFDAIVSDNRYGVYHHQAQSAILTHQLRILHPLLSTVSATVIRKLLHRFDVCWIPDHAPPADLTGRLSLHTSRIPAQYLGILSRFCGLIDRPLYSAMAVISGPEPSRSHFEQIILDQLHRLPGEKILVSGQPDRLKDTHRQHDVLVHTFMMKEELEQMIAQSSFVISRAGYSSIMDMQVMGKPALLVPTPGQPEQLYLARRLKTHPQFCIQREPEVDLVVAHHALASWQKSGTPPTWGKQILDQFLE